MDTVRRPFLVMAMAQNGRQHVMANVPFTLIVDEEAFPLVVVALGLGLERRLSMIVG